MITQRPEDYNIKLNPPQGLVKTISIWYIKPNPWGYGSYINEKVRRDQRGKTS